MTSGTTRYFPRARLDDLIALLQQAGYRVIGPKEDQGGLAMREINGIEDLPLGLTDRQAPGQYRLEITDSPRYFSWANAANGIKPFVFAPREKLWQVEQREDGSHHFKSLQRAGAKTAILGARACDLAALNITDAHFLAGIFVDPYYRNRRNDLFLVAVQCSYVAPTCFCASTGDGPDVREGYDLLLEELDEGYLIRAGSSGGTDILEQLTTEQATNEQLQAAEAQLDNCKKQTRALPDAQQLSTLMQRLDHPQWQKAAETCLACGNCTAVCPTCFCHREFDDAALNGQSSIHWRDADSCFNEDHSYIVGELVRADIASRYRQWLTHKLASWQEQYGRTGCVGCGRCITWCPVGIDFVAQAQAVLQDQGGIA